MPFTKRRWISLAAGVCIEALLGVAYAWSVFQSPFVEKYGWSISGIGTAYTIMYLFTMVFTLLCGQRLRRALPLRAEVRLGGIIYAAAILGMAMMRKSVWELCFWWGIVYSVGTAMSYPVLISYALELFPDKQGFAGGVMTAGYGLGSVLWAPLITSVYNATGSISAAFLRLGVFFLLAITALTFLLQEPPRELPEGLLSPPPAPESQPLRRVPP